MTRFILALLSLLAFAPAHAQNVPYFPQIIPSGTVIGRMTAGPGPAEAIPNALLLRALTAGTYTAGSVLYAGSNGYLSQDNATFFWDYTNKRLGLGTITPSYAIHAYSGSATSALMLESGAATSGSLLMLNRAYSTAAASAAQLWQDSTGALRMSSPIGSLALVGTSSGVISINMQAAAGTFNFNLPITAGTAGQFLVSGGGGSTAMSWGSAVIGSATNDSAAAGYVGEVISSTVAIGSATSLTTATAKTVTSVDLTAGDWTVCGSVLYSNHPATTTTLSASAFNTVTNTLPTIGTNGYTEWGGQTLTGPSISHTVGCHRVSVASTTTYYLVTRATFATNTSTAYGSIFARRAR